MLPPHLGTTIRRTRENRGVAHSSPWRETVKERAQRADGVERQLNQ